MIRGGRTAALAFLCITSALGGGAQWRVLDGCKLDAAHYFDGDSFHAKWQRENYVFRLYYVDAPEPSDDFGNRVREQAAYFGVSEREVIASGERAKKFTERFLGGNFSIVTKMEPAPGASRQQRMWALARAGKETLAEGLVKAGLARTTSEPCDYPTAQAGAQFTEHLRRLERQAEQERRGIWATSRRRDLPPSLADALKPRLRNVMSGVPDANLPAARRLDLNSASREDFIALPGIGPKMAEAIIGGRPYQTVDDLLKVHGFGPKRVAALRSYVEVKP